MKKMSAGVLICLMLIGLIGCSATQSPQYEVWGSFTNAPVISDDGLFRAEHTAIKQDGSEVSVIEVNVYDNHTNELLDRFVPARALDFWGICWQEGTHHLWIQSADVGVCCYVLQDGRWVLNEDVQRPDSVVSKWDEG